MQAESLAGALKGPRKEEGPDHHGHPKAQKQQTPVLSNARCFCCGRMGRYGSACYANMAREPYWKSKNLTALRHDGALYKMGRAGARGRGSGRTQFGPENSDAAGETRGPTGLPF
ncbi:hypothetical protein TRVL_05999 [Trypanosoma vivax]|nr:hypothetical protein TRVL_05999 [Trypanosoma vivax]